MKSSSSSSSSSSSNGWRTFCVMHIVRAKHECITEKGGGDARASVKCWVEVLRLVRRAVQNYRLPFTRSSRYVYDTCVKG